MTRYGSVVAFCLCAMTPLPALAAPQTPPPLTIGFIERPAYSWQGEARPEGLFVDIMRSILERVGLPHVFVALPTKRMLKSIQQGHEPFCALGYFKTPERAAFASFTRPFYQNKPIGVLVAAEHAASFRRYATLGELTASADLTLGHIDGFSYGSAVDAVISGMKGAKISRATTQVGMVGMLATGRFDYMFADQEEYEALAKASHIAPSNLRLLTFPDTPAGNERYLMCSKAVPAEVIEHINAEIRP